MHFMQTTKMCLAILRSDFGTKDRSRSPSSRPVCSWAAHLGNGNGDQRGMAQMVSDEKR
ncbi:MAG: hypothetical protein NTW84_00300 [Methanothrix sp.]|nr:hypothetical protein [Methanothrix sp.]